MKKIILFLFIVTSLFSFNAIDIQIKILSKIAHEVVKKDVVKIYTDKRDFYKKKLSSTDIKFVSSIDKADIVFVSNRYELLKCSHKPYILTTSYQLYKLNPDVLGVFFWQKGRPNIIIRKKVSKEKRLSFSSDFQKFLE